MIGGQFVGAGMKLRIIAPGDQQHGHRTPTAAADFPANLEAIATRHFDIDCYKFGDDWGTQQGLLVSPSIWRKVFKPRYAEQFKLIHDAGKKVWFHSCGQVFDIIGDLIEVGADVIELPQPDLEGVERLGEHFAGKVCFCCSIDHQRVAVSGTRDEIFAYARKLKQHLGANGGGFIAYIEDYASLGMSDQNYHWICEAFEALNA